ncbi:Piwi-domain-containing protein [Panus rudis PR-1116 ss-1]|nr:Piwi-domain-containing protein [Panus rudis PR-1116 ss-1]
MSQRGGRGGRGRGGPRGSPVPSYPPTASSSTRGGFARGRGQSPTPGGGDSGFRGGRGGGGGSGPPRGGGGGRGRGGPAQIFNAGVPARVDDRLSKPQLDALVQSFKQVAYQPEKPLRPGWGTLGREILIRHNFFNVTAPKELALYEYKVNITLNSTKKKNILADTKSRLFAILEENPAFKPHLGYVAHDRSEKLVSAKKLPQPLSATIKYFEVEERQPRQDADMYTMDIVFTNVIGGEALTQYMSGKPQHRDVDTGPAVAALNLILQQHANRTGVRVGKNKYFLPSSNEVFPLTLGLEARRGYFLSVRPMYKQLTVNINVCMTAFYIPGNLADAMLAFRNQTHGGMPREFSDKLKVVTRHLGYPKKHTVQRLAGSARKEKFYCDEYKETITVEEFFKRKYKIRLHHPDDIPTVDVGTKKSVCIPAELCEIPAGQAYRGTLSGPATSAMIKVACNPPAYNINSIVNQGFPQLGLSPNSPQAALQGFGITISNDPIVTPARVLLPPKVSYKGGKTNVPNEASWNIVGSQFHRGADMSNWAVLLVQQGNGSEFGGADDPRLASFLQAWMDKCRRSGMNVPNARPKIMVTPTLPSMQQDPGRVQGIEKIRQTLRANLNPRQRPSYILVLLSAVDNFVYPGIKRLCDVDMGLQTVHMLLDKAGNERGQDQYFSNVALKVNIKLGGINHMLDQESMKWLTTKKAMVMGVDVTHPGVRSLPGTPSVAAVVASVDQQFVQFPASLRPQRNRRIQKDSEEMVQDLEAMTLERLLLYQKRNRTLPESIFVFRDGVSEGQYDLVLRHELPQLLNAFKKLQGGKYRPKLSIIICGKRHHARPYPTKQEDATQNGNTPPGTVYDKGVTDIYNFDFYLQAHRGLQGQARPTHYLVLYDEHKLSADAIQQGVNAFSYQYARATKGVSLVPPAYYADLACERARFYLNKFMNLSERKSSSKGKSDDEMWAEREQTYQTALKEWGGGVEAALSETMFYI